MSGLWRAGATPHTTWYPARPARAKVASNETLLSESVVSPNATSAAAASDANPAFFTNASFCCWLASSNFSSSVSSFSSLAGGGAGGLNGTILSGHLLIPLYEMSIFWTASSSRSIWYTPCSLVVCGPMLKMNLATLFANRLDAVVARRDGRSV
jgi:hypothetical protein